MKVKLEQLKNINKKIINFLELILWIFRISQKPDKSDYMNVVRIGLLIALILGTYSFIFSIVGYLTLNPGAAFTITYPLNIMIILAIVFIILITAVVLMYTTRRAMRGGRRR